jgi:NTE family protein
LIAISVRYYRAPQQTQEMNEPAAVDTPSIAQLSGVLLNSVFLDSLDADVERLERINRTLALIPHDRLGDVPHHLKQIPALILRPSQDLGELATNLHTRFPGTLRYLLSGIGAGGERGKDLLSYLAFEREYIEKLIDLGFRDTQARAQEIRSFIGRG